MIKVVLDTNVVVSALIREDGLEAAVLDLAVSEKLHLCLSRPVLAEYAGVLHRKKLAFDPRRVDYTLSRIRRAGALIEPAHVVSVSSDEADNRFLECAEAARAGFLVTGSIRHFPKHWKGTQVVTARQLIELVAR